MSLKRDLMPEENRRLLEIYKSHPEMTMLDIIDKYASDEFKSMLKEAEEEANSLRSAVLEQWHSDW